MSTIADIPGFLLSAPRGISNPEVFSAMAADGASLQQRRPFSRRRRARQFVRPAVSFQSSEVLLKLLPADIAGMSIRNAGKPIPLLPLLLDGPLAVSAPAVSSPSIHIGARVAWIVQRAQRRRCRQWPEDSRVADAKPGRKTQALPPEYLHGLAGRANPRERFEQTGYRFPNLCVGFQHHVPSLVIDEARGQRTKILAAPHFVDDPAAQPSFEDVKLGLAHGSFEAEKQPVVKARRIVNAVFVEDQRIAERADL